MYRNVTLCLKYTQAGTYKMHYVFKELTWFFCSVTFIDKGVVHGTILLFGGAFAQSWWKKSKVDVRAINQTNRIRTVRVRVISTFELVNSATTLDREYTESMANEDIFVVNKKRLPSSSFDVFTSVKPRHVHNNRLCSAMFVIRIALHDCTTCQ